MCISFVRTLVIIGAAALSVLGPRAWAQETIKIGIVGQYSGPFAGSGEGFRQGVEAYLARHGNTVGGRKVEVIYRDSAGADPSRAKRLAEELLVKDKVSILAGFMLTPEVAATASVVNESKTPLLIFNATTPALLGMSPYFLRMGINQAAVAELGAIYARQNGKKRAYVAVADFATGHVTEQAYIAKFKAEGGEIVGQDRIPLNTVDFSSFAERIANANPDTLEVFIVPGAPAVAFIKALAARGLMDKMLVTGVGEAEDSDLNLNLFDDSVIGFKSILNIYSRLNNPENNALREFLHKKYGPKVEPTPFSIGAYDGMHIAFKMIESQAGKPFNGGDAVKAMLGYSYLSPRGPVTIDPVTRENIQNFYVRQVVKKDGILQNTLVKTFEAVKPPAPAK